MPYLIKRSIIQGVEIPQQLHLQKLKPWENCLLDTNEIWKFGGWNGASLSMICDLLQIPSPKQNMYGGEVSEAYYAGRLEEIKDYCEDDVIGTMNVMLKMSDMELVSKAFVPF
jgi:predicted PolB exonuclease-like 3'-5' exonuclease